MSVTRTVAPTNSIPYWVGETKNKNFAEGQPAIIFLPGIGERVAGDNYQLAMTTPQGTDAATQKVNRWIAGYFPAGADAYTYNIVTVAPLWEYEFDEIVYAARHAREVLKASKVIVVANSLGMFGFSREVAKSMEILDLVDGVISFVMGPGETTNTAPNIAKSGIPVWFYTAENDTVSGTSPNATINLHNNILKFGGNSWLTAIRKDQFDAKTSHQIIGYVVPAWGTAGTKTVGVNTPLLTAENPLGRTIANTVAKPLQSVHTWILAASKENPISPASPLSPPTTTTSTTTSTTTTKAPMQKKLKRYVVSPDGKAYGLQVQLFYQGADGSQSDEIIKAPEGDRIRGVDVNLDTLALTIDYEKAESVSISPEKLF